MLSSTSSVLPSTPCNHRFSSRSLTRRQLSPIPGRSLRCRQYVNHRIAATSAACTSPERTRSPSSIASNSLYEILQISIGASNDEIKAAYRRLARICHPDAVAHTAGAGDEFIRIHDAYATLSDPDKRADYDLKLGRRQIHSFNGGSAASETTAFRTYPWRNWETDQCW